MATYLSGLPRYDAWQHGFSATSITWGNRNTARAIATSLPSPAPATGPGKAVILHAIVPLVGAAGSLSIMHGDGATFYHAAGSTWPGGQFSDGAAAPLQTSVPFPIDFYCFDGLSILGGTAGSWWILYQILT